VSEIELRNPRRDSATQVSGFIPDILLSGDGLEARQQVRDAFNRVFPEVGEIRHSGTRKGMTLWTAYHRADPLDPTRSHAVALVILGAVSFLRKNPGAEIEDAVDSAIAQSPREWPEQRDLFVKSVREVWDQEQSD